MIRKARVLVTKNCNRNCKNCCNKEEIHSQPRLIESIDELMEYDEIMITGGEPMLISEMVKELIKELRNREFYGTIYLYSAFYTDGHANVLRDILRDIDGFQFTLHNEAIDKDIIALKKLSDLLSDLRAASGVQWFNEHKSLRLSIDKRLYEKYDFSNIDLSAWSVVRKLVWLENCPLPEGEELLYYPLSKQLI